MTFAEARNRPLESLEVEEAFDSVYRGDRRLNGLLYIHPERFHEARQSDRETLVHAAARAGNPAVLDLLLRKEFSVRSWNALRELPIHLVTSVALVDSLVQAAPETLTAADDYGNLPLHLALAEARLSVAAKLVEVMREQDCISAFNRVNAAKETVLMLACKLAPHLALPLMTSGADPRPVDSRGKQAIDWLREAGHPPGDKTVAFADRFLRSKARHLDLCDGIDRASALKERADAGATAAALKAKQFLGGSTMGFRP